MYRPRTLLWLFPAVAAGLFAACYSDTQSLNDPGSGAGDSGSGDGGDGASTSPSGGSTNAGTSGRTGSGAGSSSGGAGGSGGSSGRAGNGTGNDAGEPGGDPVGGASSGGSSAAGGSTGGTSTAGGSTGGSGAVTCDSSDGAGCGTNEFCIDNASDDCFPDAESSTECEGSCATLAPNRWCGGLIADPVKCPKGYACVLDPENYLGTDPAYICIESAPECEDDSECSTGFRCLPGGPESSCVPDLVSCSGAVLCPAKAEACPAGFVRSTPDGCFGPCVPVDRCACSTDRDCQRAPASCDRKEGRCAEPQAPAPRCALPFDAGPCDAAIPVFAFIDGECRPATYGGCEGNDNRFTLLSECESYCEGERPESVCPDGTRPATVCTACGFGGGCRAYAEVCATPCEDSKECAGEGTVGCWDGICQVGGCI